MLLLIPLYYVVGSKCPSGATVVVVIVEVAVVVVVNVVIVQLDSGLG